MDHQTPTSPGNQHWGTWVRRRAAMIGLHRQEDLAAAVGCCPGTIYRWLAASSPPLSFRKGLGKALAQTLETTAEILFSKFDRIRPEDAPRVLDWRTASAGDENLYRQEIRTAVELISGEALKKLAEQAARLIQVRSMKDERHFDDAVQMERVARTGDP